MNHKIPVTKPFLPPREEYCQYIKKIWQNVWLTNNGPLLLDLEQQLKEYLDIEYTSFVGNGTIALQIAIKALNLEGSEIITTPFSYVATTSSIAWEGFIPVFADIDPNSLNISPNSIEKVITSNTSAILATHVYGNPCDIERIQAIADKYSLKVIYDAAHCFGTKFEDKSLFDFGDISITSFHATKLFHTSEGGAIFCKNSQLFDKVNSLRNFGHSTPGNYSGIGINGKNSEFHAAMGLCNLKYIESILEQRKLITKKYNDLIDFSKITKPDVSTSDYNCAYYPIILESESVTILVKSNLESKGILPRRYFYPSLNVLPYVNDFGKTPISDDISKRVLCLPVFHELTDEEIMFVASELNSSLY